MVYDDAEKLYAEVRKDGEAMLDEAFSVLFPDSRPMTATSVSNIQQLIAYNTTFFPRQQVVKVPFNRSKGARSQSLQVSRTEDVAYCVMGAKAAGPSQAISDLHDIAPVSGLFLVPSFRIIFSTDYSLHKWLRPLRASQCIHSVDDIQRAYHQFA